MGKLEDEGDLPPFGYGFWGHFEAGESSVFMVASDQGSIYHPRTKRHVAMTITERTLKRSPPLNNDHSGFGT